MGQALTPQLTVSACQLLRRRRELPIGGEILVAPGAVVTPDQIVARAFLDGELHLVRVAEQLGVTAPEALAAMRIAGGSSVKSGDLLAELRSVWGLFRSTVQSPLTGTVDFVTASTGHVGIRAPKRELQLRAYLGGVVAEVESDRAVVIEAHATIVQGIFGVGGERIGVVRGLPVAPHEQVSEAHIPEQGLQGAILYGGCSPTLAALQKAACAGAVGFMTASLDDDTLRGYVGYDIGVAVTGDEAVPMSVVVTEGFGRLALSDRVLEVVRPLEGKQAAINGATQVRAGAQRPELLAVATGTLAQPSETSMSLQPGCTVRLIRVPYFGEYAQVEELPPMPQQIATGAYARVVQVRLRSGERVLVPRANVELA